MATDTSRREFDAIASRQRPSTGIAHKTKMAIMLPFAIIATVWLMFTGSYPDFDER